MDSAPNELIGPYVAWQDRNAAALAAFEALGLPADRRDAYVAAMQDELRKLQSGESEGVVFDDLPDTASSYGVDRERLAAIGSEFAAQHGTFDTFFDGFSRDVTFTPEVQAKIEAAYPCAADLANPPS